MERKESDQPDTQPDDSNTEELRDDASPAPGKEDGETAVKLPMQSKGNRLEH